MNLSEINDQITVTLDQLAAIQQKANAKKPVSQAAIFARSLVGPGDVQDLLGEAAERGEKLTDCDRTDDFAPETCIIVGLAEMIRDLRADAVWNRDFEKHRARHRSEPVIVEDNEPEAA